MMRNYPYRIRLADFDNRGHCCNLTVRSRLRHRHFGRHSPTGHRNRRNLHSRRPRLFDMIEHSYYYRIGRQCHYRSHHRNILPLGHPGRRKTGHTIGFARTVAIDYSLARRLARQNRQIRNFDCN